MLIAIGSLLIFLILMDPQSWLYQMLGYTEGGDAPFFPNKMSQEESGYFEALGGWAIGFAGALVAIKIAGVATTIQENDSIRSIESDLEREVGIISGYNSAIEVAALDAKRACTTILIDIQAKKEALQNSAQIDKRQDSIFFNDLTPVAKHLNPVNQVPIQIVEEDDNRKNLIEKLSVLVKAIENAVRDPIFIQATKISEIQSAQVQPLSQLFELLTNRSQKDAPAQFQKIINNYSHVIISDDAFFDFFKTYEEATHNFAAGLNHIRAETVYQAYQKDIDFLINQPKENLKPSEASWLLLGLLLLQEVDKNNQNTRLNHGFLFLALMVGSLPNHKSTHEYLNTKYLKLEKEYGSSGKAKIIAMLKTRAQSVYYPKGSGENNSTEAASGFLQELNVILTQKVKFNSQSILFGRSQTRGVSESSISNTATTKDKDVSWDVK